MRLRTVRYPWAYAIVLTLVLAACIAAMPVLGRPELSKKLVAADAAEQPAAPQVLLSGSGSDTTCIYFEDFQDDESGWVPVDRLEPVATIYWGQVSYDHDDGEGAREVMWCGDSVGTWVTPPGYGNDWFQYLTKQFDLSVGAPPKEVIYEFQYDTEFNYDILYLDISTDGGDNYSTLESWSGVSGDFIVDTTSLAIYDGLVVDLRFRFESDLNYSDEDGNNDTNGAVRLDWVEVSGHARDNFDASNDGWTASVPSEALHDYEYRYVETPGCELGFECDDYCWSWVAYDSVTGQFPYEAGETFDICIGIQSPVIDIPTDASEYLLRFDSYANLPRTNYVYVGWQIAAPPISQGGTWNSVNWNYTITSFLTFPENLTPHIPPGVSQIEVRLLALDGYNDQQEPADYTGVHTAGPMFDNVGIYVRNSDASGVSDTPAYCAPDNDGDGIFGTDDICTGEDASGFDSYGDGCIDDGHGARHTEFWDRSAFPLTYQINENGAPGITDGSDTTAIIDAFDAWWLDLLDSDADFGGLTAHADANAFDQNNLVTFEDPDYAFGPGVVAVGLTTSFIEPTWFDNRWWRPGEIMDSDIIFNPTMDFRTATDGPVDGTYIESVATHEVGHLFGLSHSPVRSSTMYFVLSEGLETASLESDDLRAIIKAYGSEADMSNASRLIGTVTDGYTSDPIPGAAVFAIDASTGDTTACEFTLPDGTYSFLRLPDGEYYVSIHPLDGSSAVGYTHPSYVNALVESTAVTLFVAESWDSLESAYDDDAASDPLFVMEGSETVADIITNIDDTDPEVTAVVPGSGAMDVNIDTSVLVAFSEPINSATLQGNFNLTSTTTHEFVLGNATMLNDDSLLAFIPLSELSFDDSYELKLETGLQDKFGNGLADSFVTYFSTEEEPDVALSSLSPNKGVIGMTISLNGKGFDPEPANNTVTFNGTAAVISDASPTQIVATVPENATSGPVVVQNHVQGLSSNDLQFTVLTTDEVPKGFESDIADLSGTPYDLAVVATGDHVFVATDQGAEVVDTDPGAPGYMTSTTISISGGLSHIDAGPAGSRIYAVSNITNKFYRLSSTPGSMGLLSEKPINAMPRGVLIHPKGHRAYIPTDEGEVQIWDIQESSPTFETQIGHIAPVDPNVRGELATYPAGDIMLAIAGTGKMYIANLDSNDVTDTLAVGIYPKDVAIDPLGGLAYSCDEMGFVSVVSLTQNEKLWDIRIGGTPDGIALTPAGSFAIVVNRELNLLSAIDLRETSSSYLSVVTTVDLPINPTDLELSPDGDYAYTISEAEKQLVVTTMGVGPHLATLSRYAGPDETRLVLAGSDFASGDFTSVDTDGFCYMPERLTDSSATFSPSGTGIEPINVTVTDLVKGIFRSNKLYFEFLDPTDADILRTAAALEGTPVPADDAAAVLQASPDGKYIAMADKEGAFHLLGTDVASNDFHQYVGSFDLGADASDIVISPDCNRSFVVVPDSGSVYILGTGRLRLDYLTLLGEIDFSGLTGSNIARAAISPDGSLLLVSDPGRTQVHFIDIVPGAATENQITASVAMESGDINGIVYEMAFHPGGQYAYVPVRDDDPPVMHILDTDPLNPTYQTVVSTYNLPTFLLPPDPMPISISFTPSGDRCLVLTLEESLFSYDRAVLMLDSSTPGSPVDTAERSLPSSADPVPEQIDVSPRGDRAITGVRQRGLYGLRLTFDPDSVIIVQEIELGTHHLFAVDHDYSHDASRFYCLSENSDTLMVYDFTEADSIEVYSGNTQTGIVGETLAQPLRVEVTGTGGPAPGVPVQFTIVSGGGNFAGNDSTDQVVATDADGIAEVDWTLGPVIGTQDVQAAADGLEGSPCQFTADGLADPLTQPMSVTAVTPSSGASDVSLVTAIQVRFSRPVDSTTVRNTSFYLHDGDYSPLSSAMGFADENRKVSISPLRPLESDATYWIELTTSLLDEAGGPLDAAVSADFATQPPPPLVLEAMKPTSASEGASIVLSGSGFNRDYWQNKVWFDSLEAFVTAGGIDFLSAIVPIGAFDCQVQVENLIEEETSNGLSFVTLPPGEAPLNNVTGSIATSSATRSVSITPDGGYAYAVSPDANLVSVIDLVNLLHLTSIAVGENPVAVTIDNAGAFAYVANYIDGTVTIIDTDPVSPEYNKVVNVFAVGIGPTDLAITPDGDRLVVANFAANGISIMDTDPTSETYRSVVSSISTGAGTRTVAITPDGGLIYVGTDLGYLVISGVSYGVVSTIATGAGSRTMAITPDGGLLVILTTEGDILLVDVNEDSSTYNQVVATMRTGSGASTFAISPDGGHLYMIQEVGDVILVGLISLYNPSGVIADGTEPPQGTVEIAIVDTVVAGEDPACVAFDPSGSGKYIVTNAGDNTITLLGDPFAGVTPVEQVRQIRNYPNPFNGLTTIKFAIPEPMHVRMAVFDVRGRLVADIVDGKMEPGIHTALWNGTDRHGRRVASGLYFCRLVAGEQVRTRKMMMLR